MIANIELKDTTITVDLAQPIDISAGYRNSNNSLKAWYLDSMVSEPVRGEGFVGAVQQGGSVNFYNLTLNPHGHGTHTESVGHISPEKQAVDQLFSTYFFLAELRTFATSTNTAIDHEDIVQQFQASTEAAIIRTSPNSIEKKSANHSNTHPPFIEAKTAAWLREKGIQHLLIDQPSVDPEVDGGALAAHRAFWNYPENTQAHSTITELIYVDNTIKDGLYLLELQVAPIENDAVPSRPILYKILNQ